MKGSGKWIRRLLVLALCLAILSPLLQPPVFAGTAGESPLPETRTAGTADAPAPEDTPVPEDTPAPESTPGTENTPGTEGTPAASPEASEVPETPGPTETPETSESPAPSVSPETPEDPEASESQEPSESPEASESPEPGPAEMELAAASVVDPESGETLWELEPGVLEEAVRWTLGQELLLRLRVDCPVDGTGECLTARQVRITLSPLLALCEITAGEDAALEYGPLGENGEPPVSGGELLCTIGSGAASAELELRLTVARELWEAEPRELIPEAVKVELLSDGEPLPERTLTLHVAVDQGISLTAIQTPYKPDTTGKNFSNLVLFAYFNDQDGAEFSNPSSAETLYNIFNGGNGRSLTNYINTISYGKMNVLNLMPQYDPEKKIFNAYKVSYNSSEAAKSNIDSGIIDQVLQSLSVDASCLDLYNGDGYVDNVVIVLMGGVSEVEGNTSYENHKSNYTGSVLLSGKHIGSYNVVNTYRLLGDGGKRLAGMAGTVAHEFLHSLGYADLYESAGTGSPVSTWDIMANSNRYMAWPLAYTRMYFTQWVSLETVTKTATLTMVDPLTAKNTGRAQAYILQSPLSDQELFVVEMRRRNELDPGENNLDAFISSSAYMDYGESGLIVYRVNKNVDALSNYHGSTGIYVFRPDPTGANQPAQVQQAFLNEKRGRTSIGSAEKNATLAQGALTLSNGVNSGIVIKNVRTNPDGSMSCEVEFPDTTNYDLWEDTKFTGDGSTEDAYDSVRNAVVTVFQGKQYLVTCVPNKLQLYRYDQSVWTPLGSPISDAVMGGAELEMLPHDGKIFLGYITREGLTVQAFDLQQNSWTKVATNASVNTDFDMQSQNGELLITYCDSSTNKAGLLRLNGSELTSQGYFYNESSGQPQMAWVEDVLYVACRQANNTIHIYRRGGSDSYQEITDGKISSNTYAIAGLNGELMLVTIGSGNNSVTVHRYSGGMWKTGKAALIPCFQPRLTVLQGKMYLLATSSTGKENTFVYEYDAERDAWTQEGEAVDAPAQHITLTADEDYLYISYVLNSNHTIRVRRKTVADPLLELKITPPAKTTYVKGETVNTVGLTVTARYSRGDVLLQEGQYTLQNYDSNTVGARTATILFGGKTAVFTYTITDPSATPTPTPPAPAESLRLTLVPPAGYADAHIYIDGVEYPAEESGGAYGLTLKNAEGKTAVMYQYDGGGVPVGMYVWRLTYDGGRVTATALPGLQNLLSYHGFSIRVQGVSGIRFKSGISGNTRAQLLGGGVDGYRLVEYGTLMMTSANRQKYPFVLGGEKVAGGKAYWNQNGRVTDLVFEQANGRLRFTSVLTKLADNMLSMDLAFRAYAVLADGAGQQVTVYGPPVARSVYAVAKQIQQRGEFPPGSSGYYYVRNIIDIVEKKQ